jgi:hypothetical protein
MGCAFLIVLGVAFEVTGLGLVAWQLWRVQRREFGMPAWMLQARARLQPLMGRTTTHHVELEALVHGRAMGNVSSALGVLPARRSSRG